MSLVDYGHRGVPNVFLGAPLQTINATTGTGPWNAAHFSNSQYDSLFKQYVAAPDLPRSAASPGRSRRCCWTRRRSSSRYFYNYLTATAKGVSGVYPTAIGHLFLNNAAKG